LFGLAVFFLVGGFVVGVFLFVLFCVFFLLSFVFFGFQLRLELVILLSLQGFARASD